MPTVRAGDVELDYERSWPISDRSGPPLLLIMGMSGTALHWGEPFLELLRRDFDVIAYDHRGRWLDIGSPEDFAKAQAEAASWSGTPGTGGKEAATSQAPPGADGLGQPGVEFRHVQQRTAP